MKKILFISTALLTGLCSCEKSAPAVAGARIVFSVARDALTRAASTTTAATITSEGFKVAGVIGSSAYFNETASWDASNNCFKTAGAYYYPATQKISFYAACPASEVISVSGGGAATLLYTSDGIKDLVTAKATDVASKSTPQPLTFDHVLSQLKVACHGNDARCTYNVKSITVTEKQKTATYNFSDGSWTAFTAGSRVETLLSSSAEASTAAGSFTAMGAATSVIPQSCTVTVAWDCLQGGAVVASYSKSVDVTPSKGKICTVNANLPNADAKAITFTVQVNEWGSETQTVILS